MNYHAPRLDSNHRAIVRALVDDNWAVMSLASYGCPVDLLVTDQSSSSVVTGYEDATWLAEVKDGAKSACKRRLKPATAKLMLAWPGPGAVLCSVAEALEAGRLARHGTLPSAAVAASAYLGATGGVAK